MRYELACIDKVIKTMTRCSVSAEKSSNEELLLMRKELRVAEKYLQEFHTSFNKIKRQINDEIERRKIVD